MDLLRKKRILVPVLILMMLVAAVAQKKKRDKEVISGFLEYNEMDEISGIAASGIHPDIYYVHNDSGDTSRFFAVTPTGKFKATIYFPGEKGEHFGVKDCEDISVGPGPTEGKSYVYVGDIGDNKAVRKYLVIYRTPEPILDGKDTVLHADADPLYLKYPDEPKDAETMMVDPVEKLLYVVSKRKDDIKIYTAPLMYHAGDTVTLTKRSTIKFSGFIPFKWITAGDISKDGSQVLLKSYVKVYYWKRNGNEPIWQTMMNKPTELKYKQEKQGEAIGFTPDGKAYYTTSEGKNEPIYYYQIPAN